MSCVYWLPKSRIRITKSDLAFNYTEVVQGRETRVPVPFHSAHATPAGAVHYFLFFGAFFEAFFDGFLGDSSRGRMAPVARASAQVRPVRRNPKSSGVPTRPSAAR